MSEPRTAMARRVKSIWFAVGVAALSLSFIVSIVEYAVEPVIRNGMPSFSDSQTYITAVTREGKGLTASDWVFVVADGKLIVSDLTPALARNLADTTVEIVPARDLPGLTPILFLFVMSIVGLFTLSRNSRPERLRDFILLVLIVSAGTEFYLWLWTVAADLDLTTPHRAVRRLYQIGNDYTLGNDLVFWRDSLLIQIPVWLAAMAILFHYLKSILEKRFSALILGMVYVMLTLGTVLLFRPDPYSSFSILSWWPLLFSFSVVCCGIVSLLALRRFWSTAEVTQ